MYGELVMTFLTRKEIHDRVVEKNQLIRSDTFDEKCFSRSGVSYDLRLGEEVFVTPMKKPKNLLENEMILIESGQFATLTTHEYLKMPPDVLAFITIRFGYKSKGLVNISGFHVDPAWEGKLVFSVYNAGPSTIALRRKEKVFSIFFAELKENIGKEDIERVRKGDFFGQERIPTAIIEALAGGRVPSLESLDKQVTRSWTYIKIYGTLIGILLTILLALIGFILGNWANLVK